MKLHNGDRVFIPMEKILPKLLDTVAVLISLNTDRLLQVESGAIEQLPLPIGLVGTVVVEFADGRGCEYAMSILSAEELLVVHLELESANPNLIAA